MAIDNSGNTNRTDGLGLPSNNVKGAARASGDNGKKSKLKEEL